MAVFFTVFSVSATAQETSDSVSTGQSHEQAQQVNQPEMERLIDKSLSKVRQDSMETIITCVSEMERIEAMYPGSAEPKYHIALQSLVFSIQNPKAEQTPALLGKAQKAIEKMEQTKNADESDICTLRGFLYMTRIVQNPMQNGALYYRDVMENYEKALKINPENRLARQLYAKFKDGMRQALL